MEFLEAVGSRRSIRWFKTWDKVPRESIQRILEVARLTTCPGNLQPWRAIVVERDELDEKTRDALLGADNWQGAHTQAPTWIYWYADPSSARPEAFQERTIELTDLGALPAAYGWSKEMIEAAIERGEVVQPHLAGLRPVRRTRQKLVTPRRGSVMVRDTKKISRGGSHDRAPECRTDPPRL